MAQTVGRVVRALVVVPTLSIWQKGEDRMTKAFRVEYKCGNCGKEWSEEYEAGIFILPYPPSDTAEDDGPIRCPNCNYYRQRILARGPIEEE